VSDVHTEESQTQPSLEPLVADLDEKEALRHSIEQHEVELREAVDELTAVVKNDMTLGSYIVERPWTWLLGGFAVGLLLSRRSA
jgi:ferritin-like metal-binding protein YciE